MVHFRSVASLNYWICLRTKLFWVMSQSLFIKLKSAGSNVVLDKNIPQNIFFLWYIEEITKICCWPNYRCVQCLFCLSNLHNWFLLALTNISGLHKSHQMCLCICSSSLNIPDVVGSLDTTALALRFVQECCVRQWVGFSWEIMAFISLLCYIKWRQRKYTVVITV